MLHAWGVDRCWRAAGMEGSLGRAWVVTPTGSKPQALTCPWISMPHVGCPRPSTFRRLAGSPASSPSPSPALQAQ